MLTYPQYERAVFQELQAQLDSDTYLTVVENRLTVIECVIMDEYDRDGMNRPTPKAVSQLIVSEFS